jgi:hypothetical protein
MMRNFIVALRIVGLISFVAMIALDRSPVRQISIPHEIAYWTCLASFGSAFLIQLFSTSFFGYLKREEECEAGAN